MAIRIVRSALGDLQAIQEYCAAEAVPPIGDESVTSILEHVEMLVQHPKQIVSFRNSVRTMFVK